MNRPTVAPVSLFRGRSTPHAPRLWHWAVAIALLLALFLQLARGVLRNSVTFDEGQHISRGYVYLKTGDLRFQRFKSAHPPGMAILEAAPLLLLPGLPEPSTLAGWSEPDIVIFAKQLVLKSPDIEKLMFAARLPVMLLTVLLAAFVYRWASDLGQAGPLAGLVAMGLCAFDPNLIAHGMLATTDLGVTAFSFITLYGLWASLRRPLPGSLVLTGVALGLALMAKMTAALLLPVSALLILVIGMATRPADYFVRLPLAGWMVARASNPRLGRLLGLAVMGAIIYVVAFLVVWAMYGFEIRQLPGWPIPLPAATHLTSVLKAQAHFDVGHVTFLMGQVSEKGWWYYFPVAFLIKTPIPTLILLALSAVLFIRSRATRQGPELAGLLPLFTFAGIYTVVALFSTVDIGYRHLLPLLPCLYVLVAQATAQSQVSSLPRMGPRVLQGAFYVSLFAWYVVGAISIFPNPLTFFNELAGGPKNGFRYLVDSNLDWGQSLVELRSYIARNRLGRINLSATGYVNPAVYGIVYDPLPPMPNPQAVIHFDPKPGRYYIGAHNLQIGSPIDHDVFGWFRERQPDEWIANAILVYDVPRRPDGQWVAQCAAPLAPLEPEAVAEGFGRDGLRLVYFDCQSSWVYPANAPGWYVVGSQAKPSALPRPLSIEFRTGGLSQGPHFTVYRLEASPDFSGLSRPDVDAQGAEVRIGPLVSLGYTLDRTRVAPGQSAVLTTYWQVAAGMGRPASLMAHLDAPDGRVIANGDGLGMPVENWQPGDVIVQRHTLAIPHGTPPGTYQVRTGVYTLDDLSRFDVTRGGVSVGDRLLLATLEVKP